jgi:hypothetical protein
MTEVSLLSYWMSVAVGADIYCSGSVFQHPQAISPTTGSMSDCRGGHFGKTWRPVSEPTVDDLYDASFDAIAMAGSDYSEGLRGRESRACVF